VRQVGHLPELYENAKSEKYKIYVKVCLVTDAPYQKHYAFDYVLVNYDVTCSDR